MSSNEDIKHAIETSLLAVELIAILINYSIHNVLELDYIPGPYIDGSFRTTESNYKNSMAYNHFLKTAHLIFIDICRQMRKSNMQ